MSDSESDEDKAKFKNDNYKSPSKKKRQKGEAGKPTKTYCFDISLSSNAKDDFTEVSFLGRPK